MKYSISDLRRIFGTPRQLRPPHRERDPRFVAPALMGSDAMGNPVELRPALMGRTVTCDLCQRGSGTLRKARDGYVHPECVARRTPTKRRFSKRNAR